MNASLNIRRITRCSYTGMFVQAMIINLTPLLFIPLREQLGLSYEQVGRLILVNFLTQMTVDLLCTFFADRVKVKVLLVGANLFSGIGLWVFAAGPFAGESAYSLLMAGTVLFSVGCGLLEVLLSPIINSLPGDKKAASMAMLHAFYPIGKVAVIVVTGVGLQVCGEWSWPWILLVWSVVPLANTLGFLFVEPPALAHEDAKVGVGALVAKPEYLVLLLVMCLAGAVEVAVAQWASAYLEKVMGVAKGVADLVGFGLFAVGMVVGRLAVGFRDAKVDLYGVMAWSSLLSAAACAVLALSPWAWVSLAVCFPAGIFISMLWPGTISLAAARYPLAGASMFALLAAAGDAGGGFMPWAIGFVADLCGVSGAGGDFFWLHLTGEQYGLRAGFLATAACPFLLLFCLFWLRKRERATG